jgi:hypothetical protein
VRAWRLRAGLQLSAEPVPFGNVPDLAALKSSEEHLSCSSVVPTPFQRLNDGALMGDVQLSACHVAFGFPKAPLQFNAVHFAI